MNTLEKNLNALIAIVIAGILLGAYGVQIFKHETPCPLCYLQRIGMIGVASGALMNTRFGIKTAHYGLSLLSAIFGGFVALRQISLHVCPGFSKFGHPFWGLSLYTWSFIVFASSVAYIGALLLIFDRSDRTREHYRLNWWCQLAFVLIFCLALANTITSFIQCGFGPCEDVPWPPPVEKSE